MEPSDDASSLASQLSEALDEGKPAPEVVAPDAGETQTAAPEVQGDEQPAPETKTLEGRDEKGRFLPKPPAPKTEAQPETPAVEAKVETPAPVVETPAVPKVTHDVPPDTWSAKGKSVYGALPPEAKAEIWKREQDMRSGLSQYKQGHEIATNLAQSCAPYVPMIQAQGATLSQAIPYALQKLYEANTDPATFIQQLAQQKGVDLAQLAQQAPQQQISPELMQLRQELTQLKQQTLGSQQAAQQQLEQQGLTLIEQFRSDPKNIYFSNVEQQVLGLLRSGLVQGSTPEERLSKAYAQACLLNPEVSAAINAQQQREAEQKRLKEAQARAASAKRAGFDVAGTGAAGRGVKSMSLEEHLAANGLQ